MIQNDRYRLKTVLQAQIEEKNYKKSRENEEELNHQNQMAQYSISQREFEQNERRKKKEDQQIYDH